MRKFNHIELFAGCGGMTLGLEASGFELFFANELSPMAGETFAYNILSEDLGKKSKSNTRIKSTLWLRSQYPNHEISKRLRENPFKAKHGEFTDIIASTDIKKKLLIGDVRLLYNFLIHNPDVIKDEVDLLSGGPPCQSFSLAGKREKNAAKNQLPLVFARLAGLIKPKVVLLENVKGITAPFTESGVKYYAWLEVAKAFALKGYIPVCMMLNSKYFSVPQNRPRFILIALRFDVFTKKKWETPDKEVLQQSLKFYEKVQANRDNLNEIQYSDLKIYDIEDKKNHALFNGQLLPKISRQEEDFLSAKDAIGDLLYEKKMSPSNAEYKLSLNTIFNNIDHNGHTKLRNHEFRNHSHKVKARFRFYQIINDFQNGFRRDAIDFIAGKELEPSRLSGLYKILSKHKFYSPKNGTRKLIKISSLKELEELALLIQTKKHSQRALNALEPAPAQLTIPDDLCHYDSKALRTLTVREMARFQSFPDWFEFKSKVTTGGKMRKFEVPQYTQVGNAVPPLLAKTLGETIKNIID